MACLVNSVAPSSSASAMLESYRSTSEVSLMSSTPSSSRSSSAQDLYIVSGECENRPDTASMLPADSGANDREPPSGATCSEQRVHVSLQENELWKEFYLAGNEMILTKGGRRMFPFIVITPKGLKSSALYTISLHVVCANNFKYKYTDSQWHTVGTTDVTHDASQMTYQHPFTPAPGEQLNDRPMDFKVMKMTHYPKSKSGHILLHTMHKYFVEIHVEEYGEDTDPHNNAEKASYIFRFPVTTFIAVTSYLSPKLTELKVKHNPFARGFKNKPPMYADFSYPDQIIEQNLIPAIVANPLPILLSPPNPQGLPIRSLPPFITPPQSFPTSVNRTPVSYYPSLTTYYPDPYDYPVPYSVPNNEEQQN